jgi:hypothetical protein
MSNEMALQKYHDELEKQDACFYYMFDELDDRLAELQKEIDILVKIASDYDGYDFSDDMKEYIRYMI